jgi:hypothetical protein
MSWIDADNSSVAAATASTLAVDWAAAEATTEAEAAVALATSPSRSDREAICPAAAARAAETELISCSKLMTRRSRRSIRACRLSRLRRSSSIIRSTLALLSRNTSTARAMAPISSRRSRWQITISVLPSASRSMVRARLSIGATSRRPNRIAAKAASTTIPTPIRADSIRSIRKKLAVAIATATNAAMQTAKPRTRERIDPNMVISLMSFE